MTAFFTLNRYFYPSTSSTPPVRADSSNPRETRSVVTNYDTETIHCSAARRVDTAVSCRHTTSRHDKHNMQHPHPTDARKEKRKKGKLKTI
eukprot:TRINITY_DN577_c0_g2_i2.p1 TRINITY_DN577_c0_g2~~TRINITY_DN577_c0_g2_i2.p1  ORF type:complete len:91 (-),score=4.16 TRINITY_DN577_c0_g2_i2:129-401(-)